MARHDLSLSEDEEASSIRCHLRAHFLASGNQFSRQPVVRPTITADENLDWRTVRINAVEQLSSVFGFASSSTALPTLVDYGQSPETAEYSFSMLAATLQWSIGVRDVRPISLETTGDKSLAAFECHSRASGGLVTRAAWLLFRQQDLSPETFDQIDQLLKSLQRQEELRLANFAANSAERMDIPWTLVAPIEQPIVALGQGKYRRLFWRHITHETPHIGAVVSTLKHQATDALHRVGVPVPKSSVASDFSGALEAAHRIGWPIVTKPYDSDYGTAVTTNIRDERTLAAGFAEARKHGMVLVEEHIHGNNHRLLVFQNECISAVRQTPAHVIGDGNHTVQELIDITNLSRSEKLDENWKKITIDDGAQQVMRQQGISLSEVPTRGTTVYLRFHSNLSVGGTMENVMHEVHPDNRRLAVKAAASLRIDLAGVDFITEDISRSHHEAGGAIVEVNVSPGFVMGEEEHSLEDHVVGAFFPEPARGRVPIVAVLRRPAVSGATRMFGRFLGQNEDAIAIAEQNGVWVGTNKISSQSLSLPRRTRIALSDFAVEGAVLAFEPESFLGSGLGVDRITVAVAVEVDDPPARAAMAGLQGIADAVVLPPHWLQEVMGRRRGTAPIWCTGEIAPQLPEESNVNAVFWRGPDRIVIRRWREPDRALRLGGPALVAERDMLLALVAVGAATGMADEELIQMLEKPSP